MQALVEAKGLVQISDPAALRDIVDLVLAANPKQLAQYRNGKTKLQGYFVGYGLRLYSISLLCQYSSRFHPSCRCVARRWVR